MTSPMTRASHLETQPDFPDFNSAVTGAVESSASFLFERLQILRLGNNHSVHFFARGAGIQAILRQPARGGDDFDVFWFEPANARRNQ